jgi:hypothetical protein
LSAITVVCVVSAFLPLSIAAWYVHADYALSGLGIFLNPINLAAFLWLGVTCFHYQRTKTKGAAWIFALFPIAFGVPVLDLCLWISVKYFTK